MIKGDELLADSNQNLDSDSLRSEPKSHLEGHYLPYLLEAKACRHSDERCVNNNCRRKLDMGSSAVQLWRCVSCFGGRVLCTSCIVQSHQYQPFHELHGYIHHAAALSRTSSRWKNSLPNDFGYFKRLSLQEAGLQVGLGHDGDLCPSSWEGDSFRMTILHINGQHSVTFRDCGCQGKERWQLLLEYNVFPVTEKQPETGFTIELLEHQRAFNLRGKTSLQEYYQALLDLTNAAEGRATKSFSVRGYLAIQSNRTNNPYRMPTISSEMAQDSFGAYVRICELGGMTLRCLWAMESYVSVALHVLGPV